MACNSRFPGAASLHHVRDFVPSWAVWRGRGGIGSGGQGGRLPRAGHADLGQNWQEGRGRDYRKGGGGRPRPGERGIVEGHFLKIIVASHSRLKVAAKVAEESPESRKTSGGIFIVAIVAGSKSLAYFASSASMILSASAPYTSSRYFRRRASGSLVSPSGFSGFKTTSCWSV